MAGLIRGSSTADERLAWRRAALDAAGGDPHRAAAVEQQHAATSEIARNVTETANGAREVSTRIAEVSGEATRLGDEAGRVHRYAADVTDAVSSLRRVIVHAVRSSAAA